MARRRVSANSRFARGLRGCALRQTPTVNPPGPQNKTKNFTTSGLPREPTFYRNCHPPIDHGALHAGAWTNPYSCQPRPGLSRPTSPISGQCVHRTAAYLMTDIDDAGLGQPRARRRRVEVPGQQGGRQRSRPGPKPYGVTRARTSTAGNATPRARSPPIDQLGAGPSSRTLTTPARNMGRSRFIRSPTLYCPGTSSPRMAQPDFIERDRISGEPELEPVRSRNTPPP